MCRKWIIKLAYSSRYIKVIDRLTFRAVLSFYVYCRLLNCFLTAGCYHTFKAIHIKTETETYPFQMTKSNKTGEPWTDKRYKLENSEIRRNYRTENLSTSRGKYLLLYLCTHWYICIFHMQICFCVSTIWYGISYSGRLSKSSGTEHDQTGPAHTIYESIVGIWLACSGTLGPYIRLVQQYKVLIDAALVLFRHWSLHAWGHESSFPCRARIAILLSDRWIKQTCPEHYFGYFHFCDGV